MSIWQWTNIGWMGLAAMEHSSLVQMRRRVKRSRRIEMAGCIEMGWWMGLTIRVEMTGWTERQR